MKKIVLVCGLVISGFSFGADWVYVAEGGGQNFFIDKSFYKYDTINKTVDVWIKATEKNLIDESYYTSSKTLTKYSCTNKESKTLANINYNSNGVALSSNTNPSKNFSIIFPDSIGESIWEVACGNKGKGFKFIKKQLESLSLSDLEKKYGKGTPYTPEFVDLEKLGYKAP